MSAPALDTLLGQLNAFPGVVGSMVCGDQGQVLADAFPAHIDRAAPAKAAEILTDSAGGLGAIGGPVSMLSARFGEARLMVRPLGGGHLLMLCQPTVNAQPLTLLAAATAPKLERLMVALAQPPAAPPPPVPTLAPAAAPVVAPAAPEAVPAPPPAPGRLYQLVQRIEAAIVRKKLDPFRTRGAISMAAGFGLRCIEPDTADDLDMLSKLEAAAKTVLGEKP